LEFFERNSYNVQEQKEFKMLEKYEFTFTGKITISAKTEKEAIRQMKFQLSRIKNKQRNISITTEVVGKL
jgi:hypothetical protein|tara:strand:- start:320 stop:529 length:210 start_codon:yes stop_codon:yes gene_type:complete